MSVSRSIALLTQEEYETARAKAYFEFGDARDDVPDNVLNEIAALKPKVDDVVALLEFLFLQGSESQQIDMFSRFLAANLGQNKIVHFWSE